jgi:aminoglycoside phosphotransferase family enzyme/predicted kinase
VPDIARLTADPRAYPAWADSVEVRETHGSVVFLVGDRAYKVRKPVVFEFLDYGTLARRRALAHEEVRINQDLAPGVYLGVRAIVPRADGRLELAGEDDERAVEYAVEMRRLPEQRTLRALLESGELADDDVQRVAVRLARFHAETPVAPDADAAAANERQAIGDSLAALARASGDASERRRLKRDGRFADAFLDARSAWMARRAREGRVRDCHGDLRAEHVIVEEAIRVFDRLEFDARLRRTDVAADIAFLAMDLESRGGARFVPVLLDAYRRAGDDPYIAFLGAARAWVRAKVGILQGKPAAGHLQLAERLCWRARCPLVLLVCGVAASGKTTVAEAVASESGFERVSSDIVRKREAGLAPEERAPAATYTDAVSRDVYRKLGDAATRVLQAGGGVVVDATFRRAADRQAFLEAFGGDPEVLVWAECTAPPDELVRRAERRAADPHAASDATAEIVRQQLRDYDASTEWKPGRRIVLDTDQPLEATIEALWRELDAMLTLSAGDRVGPSRDRSRSR